MHLLPLKEVANCTPHRHSGAPLVECRVHLPIAFPACHTDTEQTVLKSLSDLYE